MPLAGRGRHTTDWRLFVNQLTTQDYSPHLGRREWVRCATRKRNAREQRRGKRTGQRSPEMRVIEHFSPPAVYSLNHSTAACSPRGAHHGAVNPGRHPTQTRVGQRQHRCPRGSPASHERNRRKYTCRGKSIIPKHSLRAGGGDHKHGGDANREHTGEPDDQQPGDHP